MVRFLLLGISIFSLVSCSLSYEVEEPQVSHIPELVFTDVEYLDYEDGMVSMMMHGKQLEQYRDDNALYGREISFSTYDQEGAVSAEGHSDMISINTSGKRYSLLGDVFVNSLEEDFALRAQSLKWDGVREQLAAGVGDAIELVRGNRQREVSFGGAARQEGGGTSRIEMTGIGFSASAVSRSFQFSGEVSGTIYTRKKQDGSQ